MIIDVSKIVDEKFVITAKTKEGTKEYVITNDVAEYKNNLQEAKSKDNKLNTISNEDILNGILEKVMFG